MKLNRFNFFLSYSKFDVNLKVDDQNEHVSNKMCYK